MLSLECGVCGREHNWARILKYKQTFVGIDSMHKLILCRYERSAGSAKAYIERVPTSDLRPIVGTIIWSPPGGIVPNSQWYLCPPLSITRCVSFSKAAFYPCHCEKRFERLKKRKRLYVVEMITNVLISLSFSMSSKIARDFLKWRKYSSRLILSFRRPAFVAHHI